MERLLEQLHDELQKQASIAADIAEIDREISQLQAALDRIRYLARPHVTRKPKSEVISPLTRYHPPK